MPTKKKEADEAPKTKGIAPIYKTIQSKIGQITEETPARKILQNFLKNGLAPS